MPGPPVQAFAPSLKGAESPPSDSAHTSPPIITPAVPNLSSRRTKRKLRDSEREDEIRKLKDEIEKLKEKLSEKDEGRQEAKSHGAAVAMAALAALADGAGSAHNVNPDDGPRAMAARNDLMNDRDNSPHDLDIDGPPQRDPEPPS